MAAHRVRLRTPDFPRVDGARLRMDGVQKRGPAEREKLLDAIYSDPPGGVQLPEPSTDVPSHLTLERDEDGEACLARMAYVDEANCVGCYNCALTARSTFFMTEGEAEMKARVWAQGGDSPDVIDEAIATCPVDCIYYVSVEDLEILEKESAARRNGVDSQTWGLATQNLARRAEGKGAVEFGTAAKFFGSWDESNPLYRERAARVEAKRAAAEEGEASQADLDAIFQAPGEPEDFGWDETLRAGPDASESIAAIWGEPAWAALEDGE